ncbi:ANTAR domain-containing protein [Streptomyces sp. NPDC089424]|uniref:ANTAR domain-containing protein n=1 Tax=Streptomyces sp. NPDC089424 TaxID=3365917 RepID=UPI0038138F4A
MASSAAHQPTPATAAVSQLQAEVERLRAENRQLHEAIGSHAVVDQAIGALTVLGPITAQDGFTVLREVSQHTNTKLAHVAEQVLKHVQGAALPEELHKELQAALVRHATGPARGS